MAPMALVLVIKRARARASNGSDRAALSATCERADSRAASRADSDSLEGSASSMPAMIPVINRITDHRIIG